MNQTNKKLMSALSLCYRAGFLKAGEQSCEEIIRQRKAKLIIVATDASDNTIKKFTNSANFYHVDIVKALTKEEIGKVTGASLRATVVVTDLGFYEMINKILLTSQI